MARRMEHLAPQDPIDIYQPQIDQNYNTARAYFKARRQSVKEFYRKEVGLSIENLLEQMGDSIADEWETEVNEGILAGAALGGSGGGNSVQNPGGHFKYNTDVNDLIGIGIKNKGKDMQADFKNYVANVLFKNKIKEMVTEDLAGVINSLLLVLRGGHMSATTGTDLIITMNLNCNPSSLNNLKGIPKVTRKTRAQLSLDRYTADNINDNQFLRNYLMSGAHGFYINHDINNSQSGAVRFMGARAGLSEVREAYNRRDSHNLKHTWEPEYAKVYARWVISKELINIIGAFNVAMITGSGVQWMDDFLTKNQFDAEVSIGRIMKSTRDGGTRPTREAFPKLESNYITIGDANKILQRQVNDKNKNVVVDIDLY